MAKIKKIFLVVCFIFISNIFLFSQEFGLPKIINFNNHDQEFSQEQIWQIKGSDNGLLYFAANNYFLEFDGFNWRILKKYNSNVIYSFAIDSSKIFLGLKNGIFCGQMNSTNFIIKEINSSMSVYNVLKTYYLKGKTYFFFNKKDALLLSNNTLEFIQRPSNFKITRGFLVDSTIYAVSDKGIAIVKDNEIKIVSYKYHKVYKSNIRSILDFDKNNLLISTFKGSLWLMDKKNYTIKRFKTDADTLLAKSSIYNVIKYNQNSFIFSSLNNGIFIISKKGKLLNHYNKKDGLASNAVYYTYIDKSKNLWLGTAKGVSFIKYNSPLFFYDERNGLNEKINYAGVYSNNLLSGTYENILIFNLKKDKQFNNISNLQYSDNFIRRKIGNKEYIIIGGYYKIELFDSKLKLLSQKKSTNKNILCIFPFDSSKFYVATNEGLSIWQIKIKHNKPYIVKLKDFIDLSFMISKIYVDKYNDVWLSAQNMILCLDYYSNADSIREFAFDKNSGFPETTVYSIFENKKNIYFSTDSGLFSIKNTADKTNKIRFSKENNPFFKKPIFAFLKDKDNFYFVTDSGIVKCSDKLEHTGFFPIKAFYDNLQTYISNYKNYLFINDVSKIYCINKSFGNKTYSDIGKRTLLRSIKISDKTTHYIYSKNDTIIKRINDSVYVLQKTLSSKNDIDFWFYTSVFLPGEIKFYFKIKNDGNRWEELEHNKLTFRHLKSGNYIVKVKAIDKNEQTYKSLTLYFKIKEPFYLSIYAFILYFIIISTIVTISILYSIKIIKRQKDRLSILVKNRTEQLEERNEEIQSQTKLLKRQKIILEKESTRLKLAMIELQQLSLVAQKTDNSVLILEKSGKFEWWNRGFVDLFNYKIEKYKDLPLREAHKKIRPDIYKEINSYTVDKGTIFYTNHENFDNNEEIWYQTTINPILNDNNEIIKFVVIDTNITEIKNNEIIIQNQNEINKLLKDKLNKIKAELSLKEENLNKYLDFDHSNIEYAKLLKKSLTYSNKEIMKIFKDSFILDIPKDILSGDFLWINNDFSDEIFIAFGDASGHRIAGSITSAIAICMIKDLYTSSHNSAVNILMNSFDEKAKKILSLDEDKNENFNLALLKINKPKKEITFSSSRISLYLLRPESNFNFYKYNPNRFNINRNNIQKFDIERIKYRKKDRFYLSTDGWANQFGKLGIKKYTAQGIRDFLLSIQDVDLNTQKTYINAEINRWKGSFYQLDDILIAGFEIE